MQLAEALSRRYLLAALVISAITASATLGALPDNLTESTRNEKPWSFAVVSDLHLDENLAGQSSGLEKFHRVLARLPQLEPRPDFLLILGDLHLKDFREAGLARILAESPVPVHVAMGNHERRGHREALRQLFAQDFQGKDFYSFTHKESLFIAVCTAAYDDHVGHFESQDITPQVGQEEWIEQQLEAGRKLRRCIIYGHIPPEPECRPDSMCLSRNDDRWFLEQIRRYHPTALFFGHRHQLLESEVSGVPIHGVRSCNWNFNSEPLGFLHVKVLSDRLETIPVNTRSRVPRSGRV